MTKETQAYVAYLAGQLTAEWDSAAILDKDRQEMVAILKDGTGLKLNNYPFQNGCTNNKSHSGKNHCIVDAANGQHVCLSVYGNLFDGYDHATTSHFSGMVIDDNIDLYDYSESDFSRFAKG